MNAFLDTFMHVVRYQYHLATLIPLHSYPFPHQPTFIPSFTNVFKFPDTPDVVPKALINALTPLGSLWHTDNCYEKLKVTH